MFHFSPDFLVYSILLKNSIDAKAVYLFFLEKVPSQFNKSSCGGLRMKCWCTESSLTLESEGGLWHTASSHSDQAKTLLQHDVIDLCMTAATRTAKGKQAQTATTRTSPAPVSAGSDVGAPGRTKKIAKHQEREKRYISQKRRHSKSSAASCASSLKRI